MISGQDRYGVMTRVYYKDAHAAIVVMDATREQSKEGACRWKADLDQKLRLADGSYVPALLLVNKCDLDNQIKDEELGEMKNDRGFFEAVRASAKENIGIHDAFMTVVRKILKNEKSGRYGAEFTNGFGTVQLFNDTSRQSKKTKCCGIS
ncbi:hypothetical protein Q1695_015183 [Nippostrongylus brasiliensis]|nr:hypothetical protein Q1695_015183 [Nippostrongylus brasiliensis]